MTMVIRRPFGVFVGLAAAAALLTACGSGPSQVGAALIVGDHSVSVNQVQQELRQLLATQPAVRQAQQQGALDQVSRSIVTTHALHDLVTRAAAKDGLRVTDQQVDQVISQSGGAARLAPQLETSAANLHGEVKDVLLEKALAEKLAGKLTVTFAYVVEPNRQAAVDVAHQVAADPTVMNRLVAQQNAQARAQNQQPPASTNTPFDVASYLQIAQQISQSAQQQGQPAPTLHYDLMLGARPNTVVAFPPAPTLGSTWFVTLIKTRDPNGSPTAIPGGSLDSVADISTLGQVGVSLLRSEVADVNVRVSPRYGVWDSVGMAVVPNANQTIGLELPVRTKPKA